MKEKTSSGQNSSESETKKKSMRVPAALLAAGIALGAYAAVRSSGDEAVRSGDRQEQVRDVLDTINTARPKLEIRSSGERTPIEVKGINNGDEVTCLSVSVAVNPQETKIYKIGETGDAVAVEVDAGDKNLVLNSPIINYSKEDTESQVAEIRSLGFIDPVGGLYEVPVNNNGNFTDLKGAPLSTDDLYMYKFTGVVSGISDSGIGVSELIEGSTPHTIDHSCGTVTH